MLRIVNTKYGAVKGLPASDPRITSFKGIPFAKPPIGELRWRAPQPCEKWDGIKEAYEYGPIAVQDTPGLGTDIYCKEWHVDPDIPMSEDCLYLNVWTPAKKVDEKLPVLLWIYGGAFQWGYCAEMEMDGERLASRGIVVVSCTYRLGALGFLAHPSLTADQPSDPTNFGMLDQQAALNWVFENIAAFGGDPNNISIAGQSAGGASTMIQITCEQNFDKIKSAAIFSGIIRNPYFFDEFFIPGNIKKAEQNGKTFLEFLGVNTIEEARKLDALFIRDMYAQYRQDHLFMSPCIDDIIITDEPLHKLLTNKGAQIPLFVGNTTDEFPAFIDADSIEELEKAAKEHFGDSADEFLQIDGVREKGEMGYALTSALEPAIKGMIESKRKNGSEQPVYYYKFDATIPGDDRPGTFHSVDLWFFFETLYKAKRPYSGAHFELAHTMCDYWSNFIKSGNPNGTDCYGRLLNKWDEYSKEEPMEMIFDERGCAQRRETPNKLLDFLKKKEQ